MNRTQILAHLQNKAATVSEKRACLKLLVAIESRQKKADDGEQDSMAAALQQNTLQGAGAGTAVGGFLGKQQMDKMLSGTVPSGTAATTYGAAIKQPLRGAGKGALMGAGAGALLTALKSILGGYKPAQPKVASAGGIEDGLGFLVAIRLDQAAARLPMEKQAQIRNVQAGIASGLPVDEAVKQAYPGLPPGVVSNYAVEMKKAALWAFLSHVRATGTKATNKGT